MMAVDILLYDPLFVPVGDDQDQHLELTRTLARKFNTRFGQTFIEPKAKHTEIPRLMSLADPLKKMSKSQPSGCLFLDDEAEVVKKKIMSAVTDSGSEVKFDETGKPGVSNLLRIASAITGKTIVALEAEFAGKNYGQFKGYVAEVTANYLAPIRTKKAELMKNPTKVLKVFEAGSKKANKIAQAKLKEVYQKIGLV
jgi:tryptophanyl-tRNA synthetase